MILSHIYLKVSLVGIKIDFGGVSMKIKEIRLELQKEGLAALAKQGEPKFTDTWFPYTSGEVGPYYIQTVAIEENGEDYARAVEAVKEIINISINPNSFDIISGGESRDWDFSNPVAVLFRKPHAKIYKNGKIIGANVEGKKIVHVADLNNEGSSMRDKWYPAISSKKGNIVRAVSYVDRLEHGVAVMRELNIPSDCVIPFDKVAWQFQLDTNRITPEIYKGLNERMEDRAVWAHNALRTHTGQLEKMLRDPATRAKAEKILLVGYPEIKEELLDRMKQNGYVHTFQE